MVRSQLVLQVWGWWRGCWWPCSVLPTWVSHPRHPNCSRRGLLENLTADKLHRELVVPWTLCFLQISVNLPQIQIKPRLGLPQIPEVCP